MAKCFNKLRNANGEFQMENENTMINVNEMLELEGARPRDQLQLEWLIGWLFILFLYVNKNQTKT